MSVITTQKCLVLHYQHEGDGWTILFQALLDDVQQRVDTHPCRNPDHYRMFVIAEELPVRKRVDHPRTIYV